MQEEVFFSSLRLRSLHAPLWPSAHRPPIPAGPGEFPSAAEPSGDRLPE